MEAANADAATLVNLGKWILRYLFANLVDVEVKRDEKYRMGLEGNIDLSNELLRANFPPLILLPKPQLTDWQGDQKDNEYAITPRPPNGLPHAAMTPGLAIGVATPGVIPPVPHTNLQNALPTMAEEGASLEKRKSHASNPRTSGDYFSSNPPTQHHPTANGKPADAAGDSQVQMPQSPSEPPDKDSKTGSLFGKKFRMNFPKKLGRSSTDTKPAVVDDKSETSDKSSEKEEKIFDNNFSGVIQKIQHEHEESLVSHPNERLSAGIVPSMPSETPLLRLPPLTTVIIQEDRPDSGGVEDLYRGTVASVGQDADIIEQKAPLWLGELLLRVSIISAQHPQKPI